MAVHNPALVDDSKIIQLIVFHVGEEEFGIPISEVREIIKAGTVTPMPDAPNFIRGLINVRGDIVATIDLRARFSMPTRDAADAKHTVITKQRDNLFGLMVDEVTEVLRIPESEIKKTPEVATDQDDTYVTGVLPLDNRLIILLDLARVFSETELARWTRRTPGKQAAGEPSSAASSGDECGERGAQLRMSGGATDPMGWSGGGQCATAQEEPA